MPDSEIVDGPDKFTANDLARGTAQAASWDIGKLETDGPNNGPFMRECQALLGFDYPIPYCACAVCFWIETGRRLEGLYTDQPPKPCKFKFSAGALRLYEVNKDLTFPIQDLVPGRLPCVGVIDTGEPGGAGHAFLIVGMENWIRDVPGLADTPMAMTKLQTIEANSNPSGSRDGGGVYALNIRTTADGKNWKWKGCVAIQ